ncbi:fra a 1-associated protein [Prosopis cineraria]|uniref:fra a 1-associated protein n=1 Tax=Prosopis cineraria TaxID=364024 RepID=UPI0024105168|nr:fra a 1-associated protein [Prosopis cineraria]
MGWVWRDDDDQVRASSRENREFGSSAQSGGPCSTRKIMKSRCKTEEVEPGKFVRKCEKSQEILRDCIGKPVEVVESNNEYAEDDVTDQVLQRGSSEFGPSDAGAFHFPGLRSDLEAMERKIIDGLSRFLDAAEDMKNGFLDVFAKAPRMLDGPSGRRGTPEASPKPNDHQHGAIDADLSALAKDV